ncbi:MAG: hypothetical protein SFU83_05740 [Meiothermus sp.]|nr:hypothetical protein [Meiothermus sp.]
MTRAIWVLLSLWMGLGLAQGFSGTFVTQGQNGPITLSLQQTGNQVRGSLRGNGVRFTLEGQLQGDEVLGLVRDAQGAMYVLLYFEGPKLQMILAEIDPSSREPVPGTEQEIAFSRTSVAQTPSPNPPSPSPSPPANPPAKPQTNPLAPAQTPAPAGASSFQTELRDGGQYAAGSRVGSRAHGVAFSVPPGFKGQTSGSLTVLGDGQGVGALLLPMYGAELADAVSILSSPLHLTEESALNPQGQPQVQGNRVTVRYAGRLGDVQAVAIGMAVVQQGSALVIQVMTDAAQQARLNQVAQALMGSVGFFAPTGVAQRQQVTALFTGKQVGTFSYNQTSGASSQSSLDLCGNGAYAYQGASERPWQTAYRSSGGSFTFNSTNAQAMGVFPGSYASNQHQGRWRIVLLGRDWLLVLRAQDGQLYTRTLSNLERRFPFLDDKEVASFGPSPRCR